ncbi:MAG: 2Fe-2S iron-sulfur cluster-binding protein [Bacteriovorax sp.]|nr:2Fe-2S iron-sulfur cluster-binding protein [Bacteriovorax sp.]
MEKVNLKWNGKDIQADKGSNLLKAALDNGIEVAHYCYHSGLTIAGVCRMCMVEQDGNPRAFPSCNATCAEGMVIHNDTPKIKAAVESTLQFHLLNHPLDCPVCDQAGECGLQDYYMKHGQYDSQMIDKKVHKSKVQDIGKNVMLDAERCILCTRCTRFTEEVTKTNELGILNRGDHAEITVNEELKNDYAQNLVDICPVGALTSKDFRFKQRVWFLDEIQTTCIGCETGCSVKVSQNKNGAYRVKPIYDHEVNGHWMCDDGRGIYKHVSSPTRLQNASENVNNLFVPVEEQDVQATVRGKKPKYILSTGLTVGDYKNFFNAIKGAKVEVALYTLPSVGAEFDGILKRGDKNANLRGAKAAFELAGFDPTQAGLDIVLNSISSSDVVYVVIPEILYNEDHFNTLIGKVEKAGVRIALTPGETLSSLRAFNYLLPVPSFLEKNGEIINFQGATRTLRAGLSYGETSKDVSYYGKWVNV